MNNQELERIVERARWAASLCRAMKCVMYLVDMKRITAWRSGDTVCKDAVVADVELDIEIGVN